MIKPSRLNNELASAVEDEQITRAQQLIKQGASANALSPTCGNAPLLIVAVMEGSVKMVKFLLKSGADAKVCYEGRSALHSALMRRIQIPCYRSRLPSGRFQGVGLQNAHTALGTVTSKSSMLDAQLLQIIRLLVDGGCEVEKEDEQGRTPLFISILVRFTLATEYFLREKRVDPNMQKSRSCLLLATSIGDDEVVSLLLSCGANPSESSSDFGPTPLHVAARRGRENILKLLLLNGADATRRLLDGQSPLHLACNGDVVKLLVEYASCGYDGVENSESRLARPTSASPCGEGRSPVVRDGTAVVSRRDGSRASSSHPHLSHSRAVSRQGVRQDDTSRMRDQHRGRDLLFLVDNNKRTPLHAACVRGADEGVLRTLLRYGSLQSACDRQGRTPLHLAATAGHTTAVRSLLEFDGQVWSGGGGKREREGEETGQR
uniref:Ankyrin repeat protein n=1 Tax=Palpitomonas bilix TaxID=652834 RepID=A0A7S3DCD4_9EUKA|mmetsp:Transcript_30681/g.80183  ORF Transcript_30681/g.80183 Transcript_30681/m.80183 type:complete len:434 (+) Transcript_30681:645-1946(+)